MSAITNVRFKSVRHIGFFLWEFDRDLAGSLKKVSAITRGVRYIARPQKTGLTVGILKKFAKLQEDDCVGVSI